MISRTGDSSTGVGASEHVKKLVGHWVDLGQSSKSAELPMQFKNIARYIYSDSITELHRKLISYKADFILVDFDFPRVEDMLELVQIKIDFPQLPMIMMTVHHTEALATWALRARFLDYLVKPVSKHEIECCVNSLLDLKRVQSSQSPRTVRSVAVVPPEALGSDRGADRRLGKALQIVEHRFHESLTNDEVAEACHMNQFLFSKRFKETFGIGFHEYLTRYRLREARRMLCRNEVSVTEVCYAVGFNDPSYFTRVFRKYLGTSPSAVRGIPLDEDELASALPFPRQVRRRS